VEADGHKATSTADQVLNELKEKAGIDPAMILSAGVDTTNSALLASRLVKNKKNVAAVVPVEDKNADECRMHKVSLVYDHGFGILTHKRKKRNIDSFDEAEDLQKQAHAFVIHVNDTTTFKKYKDVQPNRGDDCIALNLLCSTHVCSTQFMYESLLQSKPNLSFAQFNSTFTNEKCLSEEQWQQIAEFEAIAHPLAILSKKVQTDRAGSLAEMLMHVEVARYMIPKQAHHFM
jgi:hypothetical protein